MTLSTPPQAEPVPQTTTHGPSAAAINVEHLSHVYTRPEPRPGRRKKHAKPKPIHQLDPALSDISFSVEPGEVFGFLGPNGSGKSTLFRILATVQAQKPPAGEKPGQASIFGLDIASQPDAVRRSLGVVFQHAGLDDKLTARENLRFHGMLYGIPASELSKASDAWFETLGLTDRADDRIESFSGGMKRRVEIAKALLPGPRLLMMDEASTGLDAAVLRDIWTLLRERVDNDGLTIALTTHLMHEAEQCDRLAVLSRGKVIAIDSPSGLVGQVGGQVLEIQLNPATSESASETHAGLDQVLAECCPSQTPAVQWLGDTARVEHDDVSQWVQPVLVKMGKRVRSVRVGQPTLEDAYLKLTGHRLGEDAHAE